MMNYPITFQLSSCFEDKDNMLACTEEVGGRSVVSTAAVEGKGAEEIALRGEGNILPI